MDWCYCGHSESWHASHCPVNSGNCLAAACACKKFEAQSYELRQAAWKKGEFDYCGCHHYRLAHPRDGRCTADGCRCDHFAG